MYFIEFDAKPGLRAFWAGTGYAYRSKADSACFKRKRKDHAEQVAQRFGKNAKVVFFEHY